MTLMKTSRPKMALFPLMVVFSINKQSFFDAIVSSKFCGAENKT